MLLRKDFHDCKNRSMAHSETGVSRTAYTEHGAHPNRGKAHTFSKN
jgi:hypothetical protein